MDGIRAAGIIFTRIKTGKIFRHTYKRQLEILASRLKCGMTMSGHPPLINGGVILVLNRKRISIPWVTVSTIGSKKYIKKSVLFEIVTVNGGPIGFFNLQIKK